MGLFSKIKNKFSKIALSFSLLLGAVAGVAGLANVGWAGDWEIIVKEFNVDGVPKCSAEWQYHDESILR